MSVIAIHQTSKPHELAREINRLTDGIERDSKLAGQHLATLKTGKPPGITWEHYLRDLGIKVSARHADRLIEAYQGPTRKSPTKPTTVSDIVSEPNVEIIDKVPEKEPRQTKLHEAEEEIEYLELVIEQLKEDNAELRRQLKEIEESEIGELAAENENLRRKLEALKQPGQCAWVKDDGGRRAAGYGAPKADCVARAITIATGKPYAEVFEALNAGAADYAKRWPRSKTARWIKKSRSGGDPDHVCFDAVSARYLRSIGWQYTRLRERVFLRSDQLPRGRLVVMINRHAVAVIDGVIHDTHDSGGAGRRPVKGYYRAPETAAS